MEMVEPEFNDRKPKLKMVTVQTDAEHAEMDMISNPGEDYKPAMDMIKPEFDTHKNKMKMVKNTSVGEKAEMDMIPNITDSSKPEMEMVKNPFEDYKPTMDMVKPEFDEHKNKMKLVKNISNPSKVTEMDMVNLTDNKELVDKIYALTSLDTNEIRTADIDHLVSLADIIE